MSGNEGVVRSSALSFLTGQSQAQPNCTENMKGDEQSTHHPRIDLHGDGRVHPPVDRVLCASSTPPPSGYGLELTFRLKAPLGSAPPLWPAALLQHLARYIFTTGNKFCAGDHVSWHAALDGGASVGSGRSRIRHLLIAEDPQLPTVHTPLGTMVGCTGRELRAAQRGSGTDVLEHMTKDKQTPNVCAILYAADKRGGDIYAENVSLTTINGISSKAEGCRYLGWRCPI
ncbi:Suppressor of fused homolog [Eumeta japonica]|uniref:Suppressor of fused homolog n=1 Tax=Eumeta variegata TaxID=151549 RepID=A0A4C1VDR6_EUMVA|nr:Suppressor of fused homolog [Eumeta japonica]